MVMVPPTDAMALVDEGLEESTDDLLTTDVEVHGRSLDRRRKFVFMASITVLAAVATISVKWGAGGFTFDPDSMVTETGVGVNVAVDANKVLDQLSSHFNNGMDGDANAFPCNAVDFMKEDGINVMVIHNTKGALGGDTDAVVKKHFEVNNCPLNMCTKGFDAYAAPIGHKWKVMNAGDGGTINWCFSGRYERQGSTVSFS